MSELDLFEPRFAAAYRRHLDKATRPLDAAAVVRAVTAQPRGRSIEWPWAGRPLAVRPAQALTWIVLLGLLIAALAVGIFIGSQRVPPVPAVLPTAVPTSVPVSACPSGWRPYGPGPVDQARPPETPNAMAFDRRAGKLVALADGSNGIETWVFDVCTNTWAQMHPDGPRPSGANRLAYDIDSDLTMGIVVSEDGSAHMWVYDLKADRWTAQRASAPAAEVEQLFYDPVSGRVVALEDDTDSETVGLELWGYEVENDTWSPIRVEPLTIGPHLAEFFAYDSAVDRLVAYTLTTTGPGNWIFEAQTWLFNLRDGVWSRMSAVTPPVFRAGGWGATPGFAYAEPLERTVMIGQGYAAAYDAKADRWEAWREGLAAQTPSLVYDSVNERFIVFGGSECIPVSGWWGACDDPGDIQALDPRTTDFTILLAAEPTTTERGIP